MRRLLILALLLCAAPASAAVYYVDCGAAAGGDGSLATPWDAVADVNGATFTAGDFILFKRGCTWSAVQLVPPSNGSAGNPITFDAYGDGAAPLIDAVATPDTAVNVSGKDYLTIQNLSFRRGANTGLGVIFIQAGADHLIIQNNEVGPSSQHGIQFQYNAGGYNQILNNTVHDNAKNGISSYQHTASTNDASRTIIRGNVVYSNGNDGIHIRANYWTVEQNLVYSNGGAGAYVGIHSYSGASGEGTGDNVIMRYNRVYGQKGNGEDGGGIGVDQWCDNAQVYYNVVNSNDGPGLYCYNGASCSVYNNTSYGNLADSYASHVKKYEIGIFGDSATTALFKNNIGSATRANEYAVYVDNLAYDNAGLSITNNVWYATAANWYFWNASGGSNLATWNALTGVGTDLNSDPLLVAPTSNLRLQANSPAINAGVDVGLTTDYEGTPLVGLPDIGAYEYGGCTSYSLGRTLEPIRYYPSGYSPSGI